LKCPKKLKVAFFLNPSIGPDQTWSLFSSTKLLKDSSIYFSPLIKKYFPDDCYEEENKTIDFIKMLADDSDNVRPELTLFQKVDYEKSVSSSSSLLPRQPPPSPVVEPALKTSDVLKDITKITKGFFKVFFERIKKKVSDFWNFF